MSNLDIIRAWKNEDYLESLNDEQRSSLPENPAGMIEMSDEDMAVVAGGFLDAAEGDVNLSADDDIVNTQIQAGPGSCQDNRQLP